MQPTESSARLFENIVQRGTSSEIHTQATAFNRNVTEDEITLNRAKQLFSDYGETRNQIKSDDAWSNVREACKSQLTHVKGVASNLKPAIDLCFAKQYFSDYRATGNLEKLESCQNTLSLNIVVTDKKENVYAVTGPYRGRAFPLEALVFSIDGHEFNGIDIHKCNNNKKLNELLAQSMMNPISFTINRNGHSTTYTCSDLISQRLRRCFQQGLCNFLEVRVNPFFPSCTDLLEYLNTGITILPSHDVRREFNSLETVHESSFSKNISTFKMLGRTGRMHYCMYIGEGICFGIIGHSKLYFHTIEAIINAYGSYIGMPLQYYEVIYKNDELPPHPSAGTASAM
ncbi:hypothetical protein [Endozoicomonas sp. SCSIO W0465]|uniref:hypothetical protein n=1 Tax=Endozoicomonas sp. SCSIO W0465 TaxID=2918516 RepID=UPI0020754CEC|nr:hypothetical protein [Endozoicomonas sp. SCSIO W0465]USE34149.1 hypothetical protein MJO57_18485 [Endozoicomonas sp. SCSIO W0465]